MHLEFIQAVCLLLVICTILMGITNNYLFFLKVYSLQIIFILALFYVMYGNMFITDPFLLISFELAIFIRLIIIPYGLTHYIYNYYSKQENVRMAERTFKIGQFYTLLIMIIFLLLCYYLSMKIFGSINYFFIVSLFMTLSGLLNFINHKKLLGDVLVFLGIENAIFLFSLLIIQTIPLFIEFGIIIDIIMSFVILLISILKIREIGGTTSVSDLSNLKN